MDRQEARDLLLSGFKPKEQDIATPYLTLPDGRTLDGHLKLVGLSGKESLEIRRACTVQVPTGKTDQSGGEIYTSELDDAKLAGMCLIKCLYLRDNNEPLLSQIGDADLADVLGMDMTPFNELGAEVLTFLGMNKGAVQQAGEGSELTQSGSSTSNSRTENSGSEVSTTSLTDSQAPNSQNGQPITV